jgi:hypothetical protein
MIVLKGQQGIPYINNVPSPKDSTFQLKPIQRLEKPKIEQKPVKTVPKFKQFINNVKFNLNKTDRPKAIGTYSFAYKQPTRIVENGGNMS